MNLESYKYEQACLFEMGITCPCCRTKLSKHSLIFRCISCNKFFKRTSKGIWDLRTRHKNKNTPKIFREKEYLRWIKIFENQEVENWEIYSSPIKRFFSQAGHRKIAKLIRSKALNGEVILEIGAGSGALLDVINIEKYIGLDRSMKVLSILKTNHPNAIVVCNDGNNLPFANNMFFKIVSLHTLEHIYLLAEHIEEVMRLLRKEGEFLYVIPTEGGLAFSMGRKLITGPKARKKYGLDAEYVMEREHINDAKRVLKFLKMYFLSTSQNYWPLKFPILSINAMIYGICKKS